MIPKYHIVHYKNFTIHYDNGVYKIAELPTFPFLTFNDAKNEIDKIILLDNIEEIFNQNPPNDKKT